MGLFDDWFEAGPVGFVGFDVGFFAEGESDVVEAFHEPPAGVVVYIEPVGVVFAGDGAVFQVDYYEIGRASVGKECRSRWSPYH